MKLQDLQLQRGLEAMGDICYCPMCDTACIMAGEVRACAGAGVHSVGRDDADPPPHGAIVHEPPALPAAPRPHVALCAV